MSSRNYKFSSLLIPIAFVISVFILFFIVSISYKQIKTLNDSSKLVVHSQNVHIEIKQLLSDIRDAETGQRGYLLTKDTGFLRPYNGAYEKANASFENLKQLTADNKIQQENLDYLKNLIDERFKTLEILLNDKTLLLEVPDSVKRVLSKGRALMIDINSRANIIINNEAKLLENREKLHNEEIILSPLSFLLIAFFSLIVFIISFIRINLGIKRLKIVNNQILIAQETFDNAEQIAEMSNWFYDLDTKKIIYSKNYYRLLGYEPYAFEPCMKKYLEFVHPDDRQIIIDINEVIEMELPPPIIHFRIIRKDGEIRNFKSIGKFISDHYGKKLFIGINVDITNQYYQEKMLAEKLFDLERSNNELSAFNQVASHDLQEPLRKIQTLISRIRENDFAILSEKSQDYFLRTENAASRMQRLIDDLLMFSRTNKAEKVFVETDLNDILENAKQELGFLIEEKAAVIHSQKLPTINAIPFQIKQLFNNLIGNSLKYAQSGVKPVITITLKKASVKEMTGFNSFENQEYYKISIADNGIGFEQEYAEKIFNLFDRLHGDSEYSGTGIGLTICKKIVENHKGFIFAEGAPNVGSTFNIFFPV